MVCPQILFEKERRRHFLAQVFQVTVDSGQRKLRRNIIPAVDGNISHIPEIVIDYDYSQILSEEQAGSRPMITAAPVALIRPSGHAGNLRLVSTQDTHSQQDADRDHGHAEPGRGPRYFSQNRYGQ